MTVDIQCESRRVMTEILLQGLDVTARLQRRYGIGMTPQIVESRFGHADACNNTLEVPVYIRMIKMMPQLIGKYKVFGIAPCPCSFSAHGPLKTFLLLQNVHYRLCRSNDTSLSVLGRGEPISSAAVTQVYELFAVADVMAIGAIRALHNNGLRVPEDVSVMGFDGLPLGSYLVPQLSTVVQSFKEMAKRAVRILIEHIERGGEACHETVQYALYQRESTRRIGD